MPVELNCDDGEIVVELALVAFGHGFLQNRLRKQGFC
jgi:hypothetical protein